MLTGGGARDQGSLKCRCRSSGFAFGGIGFAIGQMLAEAVEFVVVGEMNGDLASAACGGSDFDFGAEGVAELLFQGRDLVGAGSRFFAGTGDGALRFRGVRF